MSVPEGLRNKDRNGHEPREGRFHLEVKAEELARHTLRIISNENVFLPCYKDNLTDIVAKLTVEAYAEIREANEIKVGVNGTWEERSRVQISAIRKIRKVIWLIDLSKRVLHLPSHRVKFWGGLAIYVRDKAIAWHESDKRRYSDS